MSLSDRERAEGFPLGMLTAVTTSATAVAATPLSENGTLTPWIEHCLSAPSVTTGFTDHSAP
mgnify:CR=1 FL=1